MPKVCSCCEKLLSLNFFRKDPSKKSGYREQCKFCQSSKDKKRYESRNVFIRQSYDRSQRFKHPEKCLFRDAKRRASAKGLPFSITLEDIKIPLNCPVLGIPLFHGTKTSCDNSPTLDRLVPENGYVVGNIAVLSNKANRLKNDGTLEDHKKLVRWLETLDQETLLR